MRRDLDVVELSAAANRKRESCRKAADCLADAVRIDSRNNDSLVEGYLPRPFFELEAMALNLDGPGRVSMMLRSRCVMYVYSNSSGHYILSKIGGEGGVERDVSRKLPKPKHERLF